MKLEDAQINRYVIYTDGIGGKERGIITSKNDKYIFVNYGHSCNGIATYPKDLEYELEDR